MLNDIRNDERTILDTLKAATTALDAIGRTGLDEALADLAKAAESARQRMQHAADVARATLLGLSAGLTGIGSSLAADLGVEQRQPCPPTIPPTAEPIAAFMTAGMTPDEESVPVPQAEEAAPTFLARANAPTSPVGEASKEDERADARLAKALDEAFGTTPHGSSPARGGAEEAARNGRRNKARK